MAIEIVLEEIPVISLEPESYLVIQRTVFNED